MSKPAFSPKLAVVAVVLLAGVLPVLLNGAAGRVFGDVPRVHEPLHEAAELAGTCIALGVVLLALLQVAEEKDSAHLLWAAAALAAMGLLDAWHAVHGISERSWLRGGATLLGGLLFALVWMPLPTLLARRRGLFMLLTLAMTFAMGLWWRSDWMPLHTAPGGGYTLAFQAFNAAGGLGFLAASWFFFRRYLRGPEVVDLAFAGQTLLFGTAGPMFGTSHTWDAAWWFWHAARLTAYLVLLIVAYDMLTAGQRELRRSRENFSRQAALLKGINELLQAVLTNMTEEHVARKCLALSERLTGSRFGFIVEVNAAGRFDTIAISDTGWDACRIPRDKTRSQLDDVAIRGIRARVVHDARSWIVNDPAAQPDWVEPPPGHPPIRCFLGVPLKQGDKVFGLVGLANKEGGYTPADQETVEALSTAFCEAVAHRRAETALWESEERFRQFMDHAPAIAWMKDALGRHVYLNKSYEDRFGVRLADWRGKTDFEVWPAETARKFVENDAQVFAGGQPIAVIEETPDPREGRAFWWNVKFPFQDAAGRKYIGGVGIDITARKLAEVERESSAELLRAINQSTTSEALVGAASTFFQQQSGCEAFAIRLQQGDDFPYCQMHGFTEEFVAKENSLLARDAEGQALRNGRGRPILECMCGNILRGRFDPSKPFFTPGGGFWTNSTTDLLATTTDVDRLTHTRNYCNIVGYESLALLPLRVADEPFGLLHFADRRRGMFSAEMIAGWERLAGQLAIALSRLRAQEALQCAYAEIEQRVRERTAELARSNAELQQFAYVASHDLQEPLRAISGFAYLLERRYQGKLDAQADEYIDFMCGGVARMQQLIDDLLSYSRVTTQASPFEPVDGNVVVSQAVANLQAAIQQAGAHVIYAALPTVWGDRSQLVQLFQNLIGNAVKFHGPQPPQVHVAAARVGEQWQFSIRDNGIGIDPKYAEKVFGIFQRLQQREEYPGSGIGLSICKKVVERHGGRIWFDSQPGQGATFHFTLPACMGAKGDGPHDRCAVPAERPSGCSAQMGTVPFCPKEKRP